MKIFKKNEHSLFLKPFGYRGKLFFTVTVFSFFDLQNPEGLLSEQDLWQTIPGELGQGGILDMGLPKPRAEFLVTGACYAPAGGKSEALPVAVRVGERKKELYVFGDRRWESSGQQARISSLAPFQVMPLTWERAFGGKGFAPNPKGKGFVPAQTPWGEDVRFLPNIERPGRMIGSPDDHPEPACFAPLDLLQSPRADRKGTYDDAWMKERWPFFPDDLNLEFFNTASADQWFDGYLRGDESVELTNLHPKFQIIQSRLPGVRMRVFVTKKTSMDTKKAEEVFQEVTTHIDTVWLFPHILRGVLMHRGSTEILDEEYADVVRLFVATEPITEQPESIDYYLEEQKKALERMIPVTKDPGEDARKQLERGMLKVKAIPLQIEAAKQRALGNAPTVPMQLADAERLTDFLQGENLELVRRLEDLALDMHARYGHLVEIDLSRFDAVRAKIAEGVQKAKETIAKGRAAQAKGQAALARASETVRAKFTPEQLQQAGVDPDNLLPKKKINPWHDALFPKIWDFRKSLVSNTGTRTLLDAFGLKRRTLQRTWVGYNYHDSMEDGCAWGLAPGRACGGHLVKIPAGLVIPAFTGPVLTRVTIIPDWPQGRELPPTPILIEGSNTDLPFYPSLPGAPVVLVNNVIEALLINQEAGDFCAVMAFAREGAPSKDAKEALAAASVRLVVLPEKADKGHPLYKKAAALVPDVVPLPLPRGNSPLEAKGNRLSLRDILLDALPPASVGLATTDAERRAAGPVPFAFPDIKGMILQAIDEVKASMLTRFDAIKTREPQAMATLQQALAKFGKDSAELTAKTPEPRRSFSEIAAMATDNLQRQKAMAAKAKILTPELSGKFDQAITTLNTTCANADAQYSEGMAKIAAGKKEIAEAMAKVAAGEPPAKAKEKLTLQGLDPDAFRSFTREEFLARFAEGRSLAGAQLKGLDLSELDLRGIDLAKSQLVRCRFTKTLLDNAVLTSALVKECDFTAARLPGARLDMAIFDKCLLPKADLGEATAKQAIFKECDLSEARFTKARFALSILQRCNLNKAGMAGFTAETTVFEGQAKGLDAKGAAFERCLFRRITLDDASFAGARVNATLFHAATGERVSFNGANMDKARLSGETSLPGASFQSIAMEHGCFRDSSLPGADFSGARIEGSMIENCDLSRARLAGTRATRTRFAKSNLEAADLRCANLMNGSLRKARLVGADLRDANLFGVDIYKAVVGKTRFDRANMKFTLLHKLTRYLD